MFLVHSLTVEVWKHNSECVSLTWGCCGFLSLLFCPWDLELIQDKCKNESTGFIWVAEIMVIYHYWYNSKDNIELWNNKINRSQYFFISSWEVHTYTGFKHHTRFKIWCCSQGNSNVVRAKGYCFFLFNMYDCKTNKNNLFI